MGLADFVPATETVVIGKGRGGGEATLTVTALSLVDVMFLLREHAYQLEDLYKVYLEGEANNFANDFGTRLILRVCGEMPGLAANVIAVAAGERDLAGKAMLLPVPIQGLILERVMTLTFQDFGSPKNFFAVLSNALRETLTIAREGAGVVKKSLQSSEPSSTGSGVSAAT